MRILESGLVLAVHIGEAESSALVKEINQTRQVRPLTHDVAKSMVTALGFRVSKIRITDIIANTCVRVPCAAACCVLCCALDKRCVAHT